MRLVDCEQGDLTWRVAHLATPTCSSYGKIIQPTRLKYSEGASKYISALLCEWALGVPLDSKDMTRTGTQWMERGTDMEAQARAWYEWERDVEVQKVGYIERSDGRTGGSPDGLVGTDGILEVKCLGAAGHMAALLEGVSDWRAQTQGYLYLTERAWVDICLFNPVLPKIIHRVERDDNFILQLHRCLGRFLRELDAGKRKLLALPGFTPPPGAIMPDPEELDAEDVVDQMYALGADAR